MTIARILWIVLFVVLAVLAAMVAAVTLGSFIAAARGRVGFDAIADMLGYAMAGALVGLIAGVYAAMRWNVPHLRRGSLMALIVLVVELVVLAALNATGVF